MAPDNNPMMEFVRVFMDGEKTDWYDALVQRYALQERADSALTVV